MTISYKHIMYNFKLTYRNTCTVHQISYLTQDLAGRIIFYYFIVIIFIYFLHKFHGLGKITLRHGSNTPYIACPDKFGHNTSFISNTQSV